MVDTVNYSQQKELLNLVQSINIQNRGLYPEIEICICCPKTSMFQKNQFYLTCPEYGI